MKVLPIKTVIEYVRFRTLCDKENFDIPTLEEWYNNIKN